MRRARAAGRPTVLLMGDAPRQVPTDSLAQLQPTSASSRLLPALQVAAEAGASRAVVVSDGAIEDYAEVERWLPRLGIQLDFQRVGGNEVPNRALVSVQAPGWAEAGQDISVEFSVAANTAQTEPVRVAVRHGANTLGETTITPGTPGRTVTGSIRIRPEAPPGGGLVRYDIVLVDTDAIPDDNVRSVYVYVGTRPAGVALISFRPDWEPRFLQPVLQQALGLPVRSFLRAGSNTYIRGGTGLEAGGRAGEEEVRAALGQASLVVLHGVNDQLPQWVADAARTARRRLIFPAAEGTRLGPVPVPAATSGDWYPLADLPASPIAPLLAGIRFDELSPLAALHLPTEPPGAWSPLDVSRGRRGARAPALLAGSSGGSRWAVALGSGYWRWALRGGQDRQAYARFWGAVAGWLAQEQTEIAGGAVRPAQRVVPRGQNVAWVSAGERPDSMRIAIRSQDGSTMADTTILLQATDTAHSPALPPGNYTYQATAFSGTQSVSGSGPFTVESYTPEFMRPARDLAELNRSAATATGAEGRARTAGRPLRASVFPFLLITLLLAAEWVLRRRWGLR